MNELAIWMHAVQVGLLEKVRGDLVLTFTDDALAMGVGRPLVSVSLPTQRRAWRGEPVEAFFQGLLPEGEALRMLAYDFRLAESDSFGLLRELGRDCAGALQIIPAGEAPDLDGELQPVSNEQVGERLRALRHAPLGVDERIRISLAGVQEKMAFARSRDGWALPLDGAPSTHIFKPAHPHLPSSIANEAFCLRIAHHAGMDVAEAEASVFGGREALVVKRFDRAAECDRVVRIHQEDMCQAHGLRPRTKYEELGGASLRGCAGLLRRWTRGDASLLRLIDVTVLNVAIGNADGHAKNLSLLHHVDGSVELAPAYDLLSTRYYEGVSIVPGMFVDGVRDIDAITITNILNETATWDVSHAVVEQRVTALLDRLPGAVGRAADDTEPPESLVNLVTARVDCLREC